MIPGLGKEQLTLGSAPDCDVVVQGPGVAPRHARLLKVQGNLQFVDLGVAPSAANGQPVAPNQPVPFDFRTQFTLGQTPVPLAHPAIALMIMAPGAAPAPRGQIILGREAARASLVLSHPAVSGAHALVMLDRMQVVDQGSTSGTYVAGQRIPPNTPVPFDPNGVLAFGPVPVPVSVLVQIAQAVATGAFPQSSAQPAVAAPPPAGGGGGGGQPSIPDGQAGQAARKHRTVIGELSLEKMGASATIAIGRTPDNQIVVSHAQVSSKHAQIVKEGSNLFLVDLGSANGTYVRGQRIPPNQRVPVQNDERVYIGPMPLVLHVVGNQVNVVVEDQAGWAGKPLYEIEAWDLFLEVPDRDRKGEMK
ncbi:MAG TPA: FHA domain-containing protein, partial [Polyangiaceae bacterium]